MLQEKLNKIIKERLMNAIDKMDYHTVGTIVVILSEEKNHNSSIWQEIENINRNSFFWRAILMTIKDNSVGKYLFLSERWKASTNMSLKPTMKDLEQLAIFYKDNREYNYLKLKNEIISQYEKENLSLLLTPTPLTLKTNKV